MSAITVKNDYKERIAPALTKQFNYTSAMQVPRLLKIVINEGLGDATGDKKIIETAINELTADTVEEGYFKLQAPQEDAYRCACDTSPRPYV